MGFLDNLKETFNQGADRVRFETDKMQRSGRLRNEISDVQQQIATNFGQLGQRAYELFKQNAINAPEVGSLAQLIDDLQNRLTTLQQELEGVQKLQFEATSPPPPQQQAGFPPQQVPIQQEYVTPPEPVDAGAYACVSCGFSLSPGVAFCPNCGARVSA